MRGYVGFLFLNGIKILSCLVLLKEFFQLLNREKIAILTHNLQRKEKSASRCRICPAISMRTYLWKWFSAVAIKGRQESSLNATAAITERIFGERKAARAIKTCVLCAGRGESGDGKSSPSRCAAWTLRTWKSKQKLFGWNRLNYMNCMRTVCCCETEKKNCRKGRQKRKNRSADELMKKFAL